MQGPIDLKQVTKLKRIRNRKKWDHPFYFASEGLGTSISSDYMYMCSDYHHRVECALQSAETVLRSEVGVSNSILTPTTH